MTLTQLVLLIAAVIVGWLSAAVPLAVLLGKVIRRRESQPAPPETTEEVDSDGH